MIKCHVLRHIHGKFLRQVGTPARLSTPIESEEQLLRFVQSFPHDAFASVYYFERWKDGNPDPRTAIVDCIFIDLDAERIERAYADAMTLLRALEKLGVTPRVYFSGSKGFHVYIDVPAMRLNYPRETVQRFVSGVIKQLNLRTVDKNIVGDVMRISRLPGTRNTKAREKFGKALYCTPLDPEELLDKTMSVDDIIEIAKRGNPHYRIRRVESLKIASVLREIDVRVTAEKAVRAHRLIERRPKLRAKKGIRPCLLKLIKMIKAGTDPPHEARVALVAELHAAGWSAEDIVSVFRGAPDFDERITRYQVERITKTGANAPYKPFRCETLRNIGVCDLVPECPIRKKRAASS